MRKMAADFFFRAHTRLLGSICFKLKRLFTELDDGNEIIYAISNKTYIYRARQSCRPCNDLFCVFKDNAFSGLCFGCVLVNCFLFSM